MKTCLILLLTTLVAGTLLARPPQPQPNDNTARTIVSVPWQATLDLNTPAKPNEIVGKNHTYSGVAVQLVKTKNPLQLVNPCAPAEYGSGHENLDRDIITHQVTGFKLFSFSF